MPTVEKIKTLNIDGEQYAVDGMSAEIKAMVDVFDEWAQDEADARNRLMQVSAAKNDLSRQIILQVRKEKEEAANAEGQGGDETDSTEAADSDTGEAAE